MAIRSKIAALGVAAVVAMGLTVGGGVTPASAGIGGIGCPGGAQATGTYYPGGGARTTEFLDCGHLSVRIGYRPYAGSPTYYTSWTYHPTNAYRADPGGQVLTNHNGSSSGRGYFTLTR